MLQDLDCAVPIQPGLTESFVLPFQTLPKQTLPMPTLSNQMDFCNGISSIVIYSSLQLECVCVRATTQMQEMKYARTIHIL